MSLDWSFRHMALRLRTVPGNHRKLTAETAFKRGALGGHKSLMTRSNVAIRKFSWEKSPQ